jgi:two-component system OmpR family sensor kinase
VNRLLPLRWRLGILSAGVAGVMLLIGLAIVLSTVESTLIRSRIARLEIEAGLLLTASGPGRSAPRATDLAAGDLAAVVAGSGTAVAVLDPSGRVLAQDPNGAAAALLDVRLGPADYGVVATTWQTINGIQPLPNGGRVLIVAAPVELRSVGSAAGSGPASAAGKGRGPVSGISPGAVSGGTGLTMAPANAIIQLAVSLEATDRALADLKTQFVVAGISVVLAGLLVAWLLTGGALRPLTRVTQAAERIAGGDLAARAGLPEGRDEVGRLGRAFDTMAERVDSTLQAQRSFAADASHELRSPLTVLGGYVDVLAREDGDPATRARLVAAMRREIDRLSRLAGDLLLLTQLEAGGLRLEPRSVDLGELVEDIGSAAAAVGPERQIEVVRDGALPVFADPDRLTQALMNLVDNAVRHSPPGGRIRLEARRQNGEAVAEVANGGDRIPADELPRLFDRFYRGKSRPASEDGPHAGLGLAIVKAIAEASGGTVTAASDARETRFAIRLPVMGAPAR